ncbi:MAG: hypothetical protein JWQ96_2573 [Segetibacter sp.]|nr:hypothetical protein [Segetibacter sp.]
MAPLKHFYLMIIYQLQRFIKKKYGRPLALLMNDDVINENKLEEIYSLTS